MDELNENGRPITIGVIPLRSVEVEGLVLVEGTRIRVALKTALRLIRAGLCKRVHPKGEARKKRRMAARLALLAIQA
jgi:hypothetical protein